MESNYDAESYEDVMNDVIECVEMADRATEKAEMYAKKNDIEMATYYLSVANNSYLGGVIGILADMSGDLAAIISELSGDIKA